MRGVPLNWESNQRTLAACFRAVSITAIFVWPWNENARTKQKQQTNRNRAIWLVYRTDGNERGFWLVKRTPRRKNFIPEELSRNQLVLRFDVILRHDWPLEQCPLHTRVFFGGKTKSPFFDLFTHWLIKQITNTYRNQSNRSTSLRLWFLFCSRVFISISYENGSILKFHSVWWQYLSFEFDKFRDTCSSFNWAKYQQLTHFKGLNWQRYVVFLRWKRVLLPWCTAHFLRRGKHDNKWNILVQFNDFTVVYSVKLRRLTNRERTRRESPPQFRQQINKKILFLF